MKRRAHTEPRRVVRLRMQLGGAVQGVGFRPAVFRLAQHLGLRGWVLNAPDGVRLEVEGDRSTVERFRNQLLTKPPPRARIRDVTEAWLAPTGRASFRIRASSSNGHAGIQLLPDIAMCADCEAEIGDARARRYGYPFTNCTNCGPRFTIIETLPYDRPNTSMREFAMCPYCAREYGDPADRRFHAQPIACPVCGPRLRMLDASGRVQAEGSDALRLVADRLRHGRIVALKGLGGYQLLADATSEQVVQLLRRRKRRPAKPFALMVRDLADAYRIAEVDQQGLASLTGCDRPIVLLRRKAVTDIAEGVAPGNPYLGVMLPCTPLHHLLLQAVERPMIATSGNRSDEPICITEQDAVERLGAIADFFLAHNRRIVRQADDGVFSVIAGGLQPLRLGRGQAPLRVALRHTTLAHETVLAVGAHLKTTIALGVGDRAYVSQHIGDLDGADARAVFERTIRDFVDLHHAPPGVIAHDLHPDYASTQWARRCAARELTAWAHPPRRVRLEPVQHHHAHLASCLADNEVVTPALGLIWDGTGLGTDGAIWGGEALLGDCASYRRVSSLLAFRLPGGDAAIRQPRRSACALLHAIDPALLDTDLPPVRATREGERAVLARMLATGARAPWTSSMGRLFDGVASLLGLHHEIEFEAQGAMALEYAVDIAEHGAYPVRFVNDGGMERLDWRPMIEALVADIAAHRPVGTCAARFHRGLAQAAVAIASGAGCDTVALSGGCWQNRVLATWVRDALDAAGLRVLMHHQVPTNDAGIALGQLAVARARGEGREPKADGRGVR